MAGYKRKELQILGGGFNCLPPVDKIPKQDMLLAANWRVDKLGKLVSRFGYTSKFSIASAGLAHSAFVHGGILGDYYLGCNDSVASPTPSSVYWNFQTTAVATGFDGNRIAFAGMNGWVYIMNQGCQCRHQAALGTGAAEAWNLTAPGQSATAAAAATPSTVTSVTYNFTSQGSSYIHSITIAGTTYQFLENGYSSAQIPLVMAGICSGDTNCTVTYAGSGSAVVITPILANTLIPVSASDGNSPANLANGTVSSLPNGIYTFYYTYETADQTLESNPSPVSNPVALTSQAVTLSGIATSADARMSTGMVNIYAIGGTLQQAYLVTSVPNGTSSITFAFSDLNATSADIVMPLGNGAPPAAAGMLGPYFSRLVAWSTAANPNRLFYTQPGLPQYWNTDPAEGDWVDVGAEGEAIVWCTMHTNTLVIYKEKTIWMLVGDFATGYLQQVSDSIGLAGQFAVAPAGNIDYFVGPGGLYIFNMDEATEAGGGISPLFQAGLTNGGPLTPPGSILAGTSYNANSTYPYALALGYGMGKLYVGYAETAGGARSNLLVYHEASGRWFYHRSATGSQAFYGFIFDGAEMVAMGGVDGGAALGFDVDDFRAAATDDLGSGIDCVYQSHYEDAGLPDSQKNWLEVVIDYEFAGDTATVYAGYDNGTTALASLGTITGSARQSASFALGTDGVRAKNISIAIEASAALDLLIIHNVYLYYYEEARLAAAASTLPTDLGIGKIKQAKELELDIDASGGDVGINLYTDMPSNTLAVQKALTLTANTTRALLRLPFATIEGYIWRVALTAATGPFRLYGARLLVRPIGVYVEAYESTAGFVWDSQEETWETAITKIPRTFAIALAAVPIKRFREISLEIETFNSDVALTFLTDLPGNAQASRFTATVNTGTAGRRFFRLPLPAGLNAPVEGRIGRLQLAGTGSFRLYEAAVEMLPVGEYVEAYEASGGAVYDSREQDFGSPVVKECRELELDIEVTGGNMTAEVVTDIAWSGGVDTPGALAVQLSDASVATSGRQKVLIPLTVNATLEQFIEGRLLRLILTGTLAFRLYGARILVRPFGCFLNAAETGGGALWDSTDLDLGSQTVKQLRALELEIWAYGSYTVKVYTDLPGNAMAVRATVSQSSTSGRTKVQIPLPQGSVPDNYLYGRLVRVTITSSSAFKLFGARIQARAIGVYAETYEAAAGATWDSMAQDLGSPNDKYFDQVRFECDTDGAADVAIYTDLPGESMASRLSAALTSGATSRHWATVPLAPGAALPFTVEGRSIRTVVSSDYGFRLYRGQVRSCRIGRYLAAVPPSATDDSFNTLEFDFQSGKVKVHKKLEIDMAADGTVTITAYTQQSGQMASVWSTTYTTPNGRFAHVIPLPPGIRGRLLRIGLTSADAARVFRIRVWSREVNKSDAQWGWDEYPLEASDALPEWKDLPMPATAAEFTWSDLPVPPTKPEWQWAPFPVVSTPPANQQAAGEQWIWGKFLQVEGTPPEWQMVDVPFEVTGS